ncbi:hypothetical protein QJQ45_012991 [Haematococcus lacustris]|nr:hypothetical protein QJQ45_012991 [Haematococcus lacustris]
MGCAKIVMPDVPVSIQPKSVFNRATQNGVGIDPGVTQAVSAASGVWGERSGQLVADQVARWKLTKVKHASGLHNSRCDTERWLTPIKPHLQHLAAASSAGTSLEANLKHITVTLATWDARLRLYRAQDQALEQFFKELEEDMAGDTDELRGRVVLVDEHRTTRVSSAVNGQEPCEEELDHEQPTRRADWKPPAGQVDLRLLHPA